MSAPSLTNGARRLCTSTPPVPPYIVHPTAFSTSQTSFYKADLLAPVLYVPAVLRSENYLLHQFLLISDKFVLKCPHLLPGEGDIVLDFSESITVRNIFSKLGALQCLYTVQIIPRTDQDSVEVFSFIDISIFNFFILRCLCLSQRITGS